MVFLSTGEEWQRQSSLLLQARPTTARVTTKYKVPNLESPKYQKPKKRKREAATEDKDGAAAPRLPRAVLVLKTYDHESGVCLKFKTDRAAEVGRLIGSLGQLGRHMAALPKKSEDIVIEDVPQMEQPTAQDASNATADKKGQQAPGGSSDKKKKKKGKK